MAALMVAVGPLPAAEFQNLDFEDVVLNPPNGSNPFDLPTVVDLPGWSLSHFDPPGLLPHIGGMPQQFLSTSLFNDDSGEPIGVPLEGGYSLVMGLGYSDPLCGSEGIACVWQSPWVEQTGDVPADAKSIRLLGTLDPLFLGELPGIEGIAAFHVFLAGTQIPLNQLPSGQLSGDISAFAGTTSTLRIELNVDYRTTSMGPGEIGHLVDAIEFVVPEPMSSVLALLGLFGTLAARPRA